MAIRSLEHALRTYCLKLEVHAKRDREMACAWFNVREGDRKTCRVREGRGCRPDEIIIFRLNVINVINCRFMSVCQPKWNTAPQYRHSFYATAMDIISIAAAYRPSVLVGETLKNKLCHKYLIQIIWRNLLRHTHTHTHLSSASDVDVWLMIDKCRPRRKASWSNSRQVGSHCLVLLNIKR